MSKNKLGPNNIPQLKQNLHNCLSSVETVRNPAEKWLEIHSECENYLLSLMKIISEFSNDPSSVPSLAVPMLASTEFKNMIQRKWNHHDKISTQEKQLIRENIVPLLYVIKNKNIFNVMTLSLAKIARYDVPDIWSNLENTLVQDIPRESKTLIILKELTKELSSRRLRVHKEYFSHLSIHLFPVIHQIWMKELKLVFPLLHQQPLNHDRIVFHLDTAGLCQAILRRLLDRGIKNVDNYPSIMQYFHDLVTILKSLFAEYQKLSHSDPIAEVLFSTVYSFCKLPLLLFQSQPWNLRSVLITYLQFFVPFIVCSDIKPNFRTTREDKQQLMLIRSMIFVRNITASCAYRDQEGRNILSQFFKPSNVQNLLEVLLKRYMSLTPVELDSWKTEPEDFVKEQDMDWAGTVKSTSETLVLTLVESFEIVAKPFVQYLLTQITENSRMDDLNQVLLRESCYSAIGWCWYSFREFIQIEQWYDQHLQKEFEHPILARRIVWLLGRWAENLVDAEKRIKIYNHCITLMEKSEHLVIKLTALYSLSDMIDDIQFNENHLSDLFDRFMGCFFEILKIVEQDDTKHKVLKSLSVIIEKNKTNVCQYGKIIVNYLHDLWNRQEKNVLIPTLILLTTKALVEAMGEQSHAIHFFVCPLLKYCFEQQAGIFFMEEAFELWLALLSNTLQLSDEMINLFPFLPVSMIHCHDALECVFGILHQYILLGREEFIRLFVDPISQILLDYIGELKEQSTSKLLHVIESIIIFDPQLALQRLQLVFSKITNEIITSGNHGSLIGFYLGIFSRILLIDQHYFSQLMGNQQNVWQFLKLIIQFYPQSASFHHQKLLAIAMLQFIPSKDPEILSFLPNILNHSLTSIIDEEDNILNIHEKFVGQDLYQRKVIQLQKDPVTHISVQDLLKKKITFQSFSPRIIEPEVFQKLQQRSIIE